MSSTSSDRVATPSSSPGSRLPWPGLLALFTAGFLGILNETVPAGLLPQMSDGLGLSEAAAGQTITVYAVATALTALPLNAALAHLGRRRLLLGALAVFAVGNLVVATTDSFTLILVARFASGVSAGLIWSNIGGIAARLVPEASHGKAIAVALAGTPAALTVGLPAGTFLGDATDWHTTFAIMAGLAVVLMVWTFLALPVLESVPTGARTPVWTTLRGRGVPTILLVVLTFITTHNLLYTYLQPLARRSGLSDQIEWVLLTFGIAAFVSIWATGRLIDPHHRALMIISSALLAGSTVVLGLAGGSAVVFYLGVASWGLAFGGSATLFVTAAIRAAGSDDVQAGVVTVFNVSIAAGGLLGGLLLAGWGVTSIPWAAVAVVVPALVCTIVARRTAFPRWAPATRSRV